MRFASPGKDNQLRVLAQCVQQHLSQSFGEVVGPLQCEFIHTYARAFICFSHEPNLSPMSFRLRAHPSCSSPIDSVLRRPRPAVVLKPSFLCFIQLYTCHNYDNTSAEGESHCPVGHASILSVEPCLRVVRSDSPSAGQMSWKVAMTLWAQFNCSPFFPVRKTTWRHKVNEMVVDKRALLPTKATKAVCSICGPT